MSSTDLLQQLEGVSDVDLMYIPDNEMAGVLEGIGKLMRSNSAKANRYLEKIAKATKHKKGFVVERRPPLTKDLSKKAIFERMAYKVNPDVREKLYRGEYTIEDYVAYAIKKGAGLNKISLLESSDTEAVGLTNLNNAKVKNQSAFLITSIQLLSGTGDNVNEINFGLITGLIANGVFTLKVGQKIYIEKASNQVFKRENVGDFQKGEFKLDIPIMVNPDEEIIFDIEVATNLPEKTYLKVIFYGARTIKN